MYVYPISSLIDCCIISKATLYIVKADFQSVELCERTEIILFKSSRAELLFVENWRKCKFQPEKILVDISDENETEVMHRIIFRASNNVKTKSVSAVAMTTMAFQYGFLVDALNAIPYRIGSLNSFIL